MRKWIVLLVAVCFLGLPLLMAVEAGASYHTAGPAQQPCAPAAQPGGPAQPCAPAAQPGGPAQPCAPPAQPGAPAQPCAPRNPCAPR